MKIETLDDLIAVSGCCCSLPDFGEGLSIDGEYLTATSRVPCYYSALTRFDVTAYYRERDSTSEKYWPGFGDTYTIFSTYSKQWDSLEDDLCDLATSTTTTGTSHAEPSLTPPRVSTITIDDVGVPPADTTRTTVYEILSSPGGSLVYRHTATETYKNAYAFDDDLITEAEDLIALLGWDDAISTSTGRSTLSASGSIPTTRRSTITKGRFRFVIPTTFLGINFKVTWDILEEPTGWDDPSPTVFRSFFLENQTWEWTGPGDPDVADSWVSPWYEIPPPTTEGERRVVNVRYEFFTSAQIGSKPQVTGEAIADDEL